MKQLGENASRFIETFISDERLPAGYAETVSRYFGLAVQRIHAMVRQTSRVQVIGINGAQGTGKSTVSACIAGLLSQLGIRALVLSIDDLYYPRNYREQLGETVHPLLSTRGVPGTHDMVLGKRILDVVTGAAPVREVEVPGFDKSVDDRAATGTLISADTVDVVLFEGWCVGARPQSDAALAIPCNDLEQAQDADGVWRKHVNDALSGVYADVFGRLDYLIMLKPPAFDVVYRWRGEQEEKLKQRLAAEGIADSLIMSSEALRRFISHYERLTRWMLDEMPSRADEVFLIGDDHRVCGHVVNNTAPTRHMISTDLDASLLNDDYQWTPATAALHMIARHDAVLVLNSSKTVREMQPLAAALMRDCGLGPIPIVAENGAVLALPIGASPDEYALTYLGPRRDAIVAVAHQLRKASGCEFTGFADMSPKTLMAHTGLSFESAQMAMDRQATEPILWHGTDAAWTAFVQALGAAGIRAVRGGRFVHLMGATDKADGQRAALEWCQTQYPDALWTVVACGDSPNDVGMLDAADVAVVIPNPFHHLKLTPSALYCMYPSSLGPTGWNEAILSLLRNSN